MEATRLGRQSGDQGTGPGVPTPPAHAWVSVVSQRAVSPAGEVMVPLRVTALWMSQRAHCGWQSDHTGSPPPLAQASIRRRLGLEGSLGGCPGRHGALGLYPLAAGNTAPSARSQPIVTTKNVPRRLSPFGLTGG